MAVPAADANGLRPGVLKVRHAAGCHYVRGGWAAAGVLAVIGLVIFKPARLAEAAAIIGQADAPEEVGLQA